VTGPHLSVATIASYVDDALDVEAREVADRHLAACAACRAELAELCDLVGELPPTRRRLNWAIVGGALAAAGIAGLLLGTPKPPTRGPSPDVERAKATAVTAVEIVEPSGSAPGGAVRHGRIVWRSVEPQATYKVTITDTTGATRFSTETSDTVVVLPPSARMDAGARYYLYFDALRADGSSVQSGLRTFTIAP
jgi:hypothetical protein